MMEAGSVQCWGRDFFGVTNDSPVDIPGVSEAFEVAVGSTHACTIRSRRRASVLGQQPIWATR